MLKYLFLTFFFVFCALPETALAVSSAQTRQEHTYAQLHADTAVTDGKAPVQALLHLTIDPEWHTYWKNPGDSGIATHIEWQLPDGWNAGEIKWQPPTRLPYGPLMNYGYSADAYHIITLTPPQNGVKPGESGTFTAKANWLVCREECIPESAELTFTLPYGENTAHSGEHGRISGLLATTQIGKTAGKYSRDKAGNILLHLPAGSVVGAVKEAYFFADEAAAIEPATPQTLTKQADGSLELRMQAGGYKVKGDLTGIAEFTREDGSSIHLQVMAQEGEIPATTSAPIPAPNTDSGAQKEHVSIVVALLFALLGGVVLNAMPCVFPVLSLKALGLSKKTASERRKVRAHGFSYTAGVVGSFALVGLALIVLKASGSAIGWGYQMQSPYFVASLTYLLFLIGLNLAGFFDITFHMAVNTHSSEKETLKGSFAMGALVTLVATPCSAPFMATALGAALSQPPAVGMAIFLVMGFGLALPYLLLCTVPGALKWMPKPGVWMERFKQFLAYPMFLSAIWLAWVFMQQTGADATALLLIGLMLAAFGIWLWRAYAPPASAVKRLVLGLLLAALALSPLALWRPMAVQPGDTAAEMEHTAFSAEKLAALRAEGKPVFVYATAAWCITCKVNERAALQNQQVKDRFASAGITIMVADWTREDPAITRYLETFGRAGVPLYVFYPAEGGQPRILPQLLTPTLVIESTH